ncbi:MAG TPA: DUF6029 family protein [Saprospiraceae bacterium]|nr:DUF6029 family protein [Saprospiraceae bacterium]
MNKLGTVKQCWLNTWMLIVLHAFSISSQNPLRISGVLENNINQFIRDSLIGAEGIPQYENNDLGGELWFDLNASYKGIRAGIRLDAFRNSNLLNPNDSYTEAGLGRFYISGDIGKLSLYTGYIYDQIGSGIIFRSYQERPLLIDNALVGGMARYTINDRFSITGYYGGQKQLFGLYPNLIRGFSADGYFEIGKEEKITMAPGIGYINRLLSDSNMDGIVDVLRTYLEEDRVTPRFNVYMGTLYNTLTYKAITWYVEGAVKSPDLFFDPNAIRTEITGRKAFGKYVRKPGTVFYTSLSMGLKNLGITMEGKRTRNFNVRIDPLQRQNFGLLSFIPPMNQQSTYRLLSRYNPATQEISEMAWQLDIQHKFSNAFRWSFNLSDIYTLENKPLFKEFYFSMQYNKGRKWQWIQGIQILEYNQEIYEVKPGVPMLRAYVPFADFLYRFKSNLALRSELQYMHTRQDYGSWLFFLQEWTLAPHWQFELSGMYNIQPATASPTDPVTGEKLKILYPNIGTTFSHGAKRISLRYVKQVEGVVCTGGICRLEPAFSGIRMNTYVQF